MPQPLAPKLSRKSLITAGWVLGAWWARQKRHLCSNKKHAGGRAYLVRWLLLASRRWMMRVAPKASAH